MSGQSGATYDRYTVPNTPIISARKKQIKFQTAATSTGDGGESESESESENENGRHLCALFNPYCFALSNVRMRKVDATCRPIVLHGRVTRDYYAPLRFEFEFDRRNRRARHVIESWSRKLWGIREFATSIGKDAAASAQHRDRDHREIRRGCIKAASTVQDRPDPSDSSR